LEINTSPATSSKTDLPRQRPPHASSGQIALAKFYCACRRSNAHLPSAEMLLDLSLDMLTVLDKLGLYITTSQTHMP